MTRSLFSLFIFFNTTTQALATGWNDYELEIGDGWTIMRPYSGCHCLVQPDGQMLLNTNDLGKSIYGFRAFASTSTHIFLECESDEFFSTPERRFLVVAKSDPKATPLLTLSEFQQHLAVATTQINWQPVRNPNLLLPILGSLLFLLFAALYFGPITIPIVLILLSFTTLLFLIRRRHSPPPPPRSA